MQPKHANSWGYTLIEILVVLFIISLVAGTVLVHFKSNDHKQLEILANSLEQTLIFAEEQAILQSLVLGLSFNQQLYQFSFLQTTNDGEQRWVTIQDDSPLRPQAFDNNINIVVNVAGQQMNNDKKSQIPSIVISNGGEFTPFVIYIGKKNQKPQYVISGDVDGSIHKQVL